ncbi:DNA mismatch repair endonuclease MutL [Vibrio plantisponsor]|uniref:DNA mismatch repair protein MutL n=1 Tax=Vibrio plantisponsor TaxID=664643 RepID=A0ABU4ILQ0_9VIBR|nr:DNA mismatch repair endonuclease MutL [Vibrio plantisponsor]MDW6018224.1 DNA mismatch repair endonuclease MutL [Vibrio plantisponsor]NNM42545.1 DNA mismatch repair endonuclease MutL [Vibrio plantisponsor]
MTIQILPARLANQIAAGEVVERPASVVKELVENSLDSGATRIDIDIEKGGAKLIRIRDNGCGIAKEELGLALSRHATSKIHTLDDLEAIISLGFRGEALASISSVSRLTLTSRPATQEEAWSAYSEGREMEVKLQPAAHPIGSTVEVLDLFFNTPARRKFLRTEKTEFTHIDELLKRIALSRFDVTFNLRHNGKMVRQYRAAKTEIQAEKRIAAVCGSAFVRSMLKIELEHQGLRLHGWITTPEGARQQSDIQYCYVNGRMMRDKLINHAIRQSYESSLRADQFATYVLYIEIDPHQVDVNVHPAKHEVRFHQARLVHDFIYQALSSALAESQHIDAPSINEGAFHSPDELNHTQDTHEPVKRSEEAEERARQAVENSPAYPRKASSERSYSPQNDSYQVRENAQRSEWMVSDRAKSKSPQERVVSKSPSKAEVYAYQELMKTPEHTEKSATAPVNNVDKHELEKTGSSQSSLEPVLIEQLGKAISIVQERYLLMNSPSGCVLVSLHKAEWFKVLGQLNVEQGALKSQPLLVPLSLKISSQEVSALEHYQAVFARFGIEFQRRSAQSVMLMGVPQPLRQQNLQNLVQDLLSYAASNLAQGEGELDTQVLAQWLSDHVTVNKSSYTLSEAIQLIAELEQLWQGKLPLHDAHFVKPVDFTATIQALNI